MNVTKDNTTVNKAVSMMLVDSGTNSRISSNRISEEFLKVSSCNLEQNQVLNELHATYKQKIFSERYLLKNIPAVLRLLTRRDILLLWWNSTWQFVFFHRCACREGFQLGTDGTSCIGSHIFQTFLSKFINQKQCTKYSILKKNAYRNDLDRIHESRIGGYLVFLRL